MTSVAAALVSQTTFQPTPADIELVHRQPPRLLGPIFGKAIIDAACAAALDMERLAARVKKLFFEFPPDRKPTLALSVARHAAAFEGAPAAAWAAARGAAAFCIGLGDGTDALWHLLGSSNCTSAAGDSGRRRRNNWYAKMTQMAVALTPTDGWPRAHLAMRKNPDLRDLSRRRCARGGVPSSALYLR